MKLTLTHPLVCLDIETTGLDIVKDRIIEISLVKLNQDSQKTTKTFLINPECVIPQESLKIHGITDEMLKGKPVFAEVANEVKQFIEGCHLCGYNSQKFDLPILNEEFLRAGIEIDLTQFTSVDVQRIFHKMEPRDLPAAYNFYCNKQMDNHHSAEADAVATLDIFIAQVERYNNLGDTVESISHYLGAPASLDSMNRIVNKEGVPTFNFGKHKGKSVEKVFKEEPQYYDWMMRSDFSLHTKEVLSKLYIQFTLKK